MKSSFNLGVLEIFAYLAPGLIVTYSFIHNNIGGESFSTISIGNEVTFILIAGYIVGHLLTIGSQPMIWLRGFLKAISNSKKRPERYEFYSDLLKLLEEFIGYRPSKSDQYLFSLRLVAEYCEESNRTIDRLFALTLFSRNAVVAFLLASIFWLPDYYYISLGCISISVLFFLRYVHFERDVEGTVFRSAFLWLKSNQNETTNKAN